MIIHWIASFALALLLSPLLLGVIHRTKAFFAGRKGVPLFQVYFDLWKLLQKGAVYSVTTTPIFRLGPAVLLGSTLLAFLFVPLGKAPAFLAFEGDFILFVYFLALGRFFMILAALDTGSSFEGMGASREAQFSVFTEAAFVLSLLVCSVEARSFSLNRMVGVLSFEDWWLAADGRLLAAAALFCVFLAENARIPVDDPNTHLELTMIHEVMVLDHGGVDLAFIVYADALKLWLLGALLIHLVLPLGLGNFWIGESLFTAGLLALAVLVGVIESTMARFRLRRVPHLLMGACICAVLALVLVLR
jgi:formate hydrogenlyase subunit 4